MTEAAHDRRPSRRADIQGLRAVAVVAVILGHVLGWPRGGFLGVDVFFVISGFLITGLLLRELDQTGRVGFRAFYARRVRRILPAATLVVVATVGAAQLVFVGVRARSVRVDALWAEVFLANWHFADVGTDYFRSGFASSPLEHLWSLSVEEQFYLLWPAVLLAVVALGARLAARTGRVVTSRRAVAALVLAVTVASCAWGWTASRAEPTVAYFSTLTRAWELAAGAVVAVAATRAARLPAGLRPWLAWTGTAAIVGALLVTSPTWAFPVPGALPVVLATCAVLVAGIGRAGAGPRVLANPGTGYVGTLSYSLYLWHLPVLVIGAAVVGGAHGAAFDVLVLALTAALSALTYHLVERPVLVSPWAASPRPDREARRTAWREWRSAYRRSYRPGAAAAIACVVVLAAGTVLVQHGRAPDVAIAAGPATDAPADGGGSPESALAAQIVAALGTAEWPDLRPSLAALGPSARATEWARDGCLAHETGARGTPMENAARCVYGDADAPHQALVIGDSIAITWMPALRAALGDQWRIQVLAMATCPIAELTMLDLQGAPFDECTQFQSDVRAAVDASGADLVVASQTDGTMLRLASHAVGSDAQDELRQGWQSLLLDIAPHVGSVVVLGHPPEGKALTDCATALNRPADCATTIPNGHRVIATTEGEAVDATGLANVRFVDVDAWVCTPTGVCPAFVGTTPVRADAWHLTDAYSRSLAPVLRDALAGVTDVAGAPVLG